MGSIAVVNEQTTQYQSFPMGDDMTAEDVLRLFTEEVAFSGPFTLVEEQATYIPGEDFDSHSIDPERQVIVYDMHGPHEIVRPDFTFDFLIEIPDWIDDMLEPNGEGEYAIGQIIEPEDLA